MSYPARTAVIFISFPQCWCCCESCSPRKGSPLCVPGRKPILFTPSICGIRKGQGERVGVRIMGPFSDTGTGWALMGPTTQQVPFLPARLSACLPVSQLCCCLCLPRLSWHVALAARTAVQGGGGKPNYVGNNLPSSSSTTTFHLSPSIAAAFLSMQLQYPSARVQSVFIAFAPPHKVPPIPCCTNGQGK